MGTVSGVSLLAAAVGAASLGAGIRTAHIDEIPPYGCKVTVASARTRPPAPAPRSFNYGNGSIAVALNPPNGHLVAGPLPGGGERATINADGSIDAKVGWWRAGDGPIRIGGRRLDAGAPPLAASVPGGYARGFQATGLTFPTTGCWRVTGAFGRARLSFVVLVTKP
jgi:hypothetical protein